MKKLINVLTLTLTPTLTHNFTVYIQVIEAAELENNNFKGVLALEPVRNQVKCMKKLINVLTLTLTPTLTHNFTVYIQVIEAAELENNNFKRVLA